MKEPSEKDIKKEKQSELDKIAETNAKCVAGYQVIRNTVFNNISDGDLTKMNKYIKTEYGKVYTGLKGMIIDALNDAKDKNVKLVEKLLDERLPPAKHYEVLPKAAPFKYTNRVFTEKSVSVRSQKAADAITKIIADGRNDGLAIKDIQKKVDIVMGFRDAQGRLTDKSKKLIESGKFAHRNGSIYETYRIARTEVIRMNAFAKYDQFDELRQRYPNARLKLLATLDDRTRVQSREMNGQISNAKGEFLYPDSKYYRLGTAPAQWCINDRETCTIVFLTNKEAKENREELRELKEALQEDNAQIDVDTNNNSKLINNTLPTSLKLDNKGYREAKTIEEAVNFAKDIGVRFPQYENMSLEYANEINKALLTIPINFRPAAIMDMRTAYKTEFIVKARQRKLKSIYGVCNQLYGYEAKLTNDIDLRNKLMYRQGIAYNSTTFKTFKQLEQSKIESNKLYEEKFGKRWNFNLDGRATIYHEMAHCYANNYQIPKGFEPLAKRWFQETNIGQIEKVSEAWAEAFAGYQIDNPELPDYIKSYMKGLSL